MFGLLFFLAFLLLAVNVVLSLYARTLVGAAAYDAARRLAEDTGLEAESADRHVRSLLGAVPVEVRVLEDEVDVSVEVRARPGFIVVRRIGPVSLGDIRRVATVRREEPR